MTDNQAGETFATAARKVGAVVEEVADLAAAVAYIASRTGGDLLLSPCPSLRPAVVAEQLKAAGVSVVDEGLRCRAAGATAGLTGANFAIAATGTVVLESTAEAVRLASTLPPVHFVLLDPRKIVADSAAAVPVLRRLHERLPRTYLAYITGPSRTADIERVLTIGVHGPKELHILLCAGLSEDVLES